MFYSFQSVSNITFLKTTKSTAYLQLVAALCMEELNENNSWEGPILMQ